MSVYRGAQEDLAEHLVAGHLVLRRRRVGERELGVDQRLEVAVAVQLPRRAELVGPVRTRTDDRDVRVEQVTERRDGRLVARRVAARHQPPADAEGEQRRAEQCRSDVVEHEVHTPALRDASCPADDVAGPVVQNKIGPEPEGTLALLVRAGRRQHRRARVLGELYAGDRHPRTRGMDEHRLPGMQVTDVKERVCSGEPARGERRSMLDRHAVGDAIDVAGGGQAQLGVAAVLGGTDHGKLAEQVALAGELRTDRNTGQRWVDDDPLPH
jgi:hypothetical protein